VPDVQLTEREAALVAVALEPTLYATFGRGSRNGLLPTAELCQLAAKLAAAVPEVAVKLPSLLDIAGPQARAAVRAEARRVAASRLDQDGAGAAGSVTALLSASEAARLAGVSSQAIRAAAAAGRLAARKDRVTGVWLIDATALAVWEEARRAA